MNDEEKFIESLYEEANNQLKEVYRNEKKFRDELLNEIAMIMLTYTILDGLMSIGKIDKDKCYKKLSGLILSNHKSIGNNLNNILNDVLNSTVDKTFDFYNYNSKLKEVEKIIKNNFKGKHFSERVWDNESKVAKHLHKQVEDFLNGKINVNQIKKDIEKTYNTSSYNAKRLVETEVNRCEDEAFRRFCKETGVKKVKRNEVLDNKICEACKELDGKVFNLDDAPGVIHPLCRGFNEIYE